jgi:hypothetical protein
MTQPTNQPTNKQTNQPPTQPTTPLRDLLAVILLLALVLAFFWKIALAGRVLAGGDVFTYFYPYWAEATRAIRAGRLPLWNPYLFLGAPFLANSQAGVFYPLNWPLWLLLPAHQSVHVTIVLHLCLAALNAYLWGRASLRLGRLGAWTVGATFALGGYLGAQVEHVNQLQGLAWLPLMLTLADTALDQVEGQLSDRKSLDLPGSPQLPGLSATFARVRRTAALVGLAPVGLVVVVSLVLLAGHTQTAFISLVGLAVYGLGPALWRALRWRELGPPARRAACLVAVAGLGIALAAVQLLPTWELSRLSVRAGGLPFNERVSFSLSPLYLPRALLPGFAEPVLPEHIEHVAYIGIAGLALAALALRSLRFTVCNLQPAVSNLQTAASSLQPAVLNLQPAVSRLQPAVLNLQPAVSRLQASTCLLALGLFLSLGFYNPLYLLLARFVPGFAHFRVPARWLALTAAGAAALAGWGADALYHRRRPVDWRAFTLLAVVLVVLTGWAVVVGHVGEGKPVCWPTIAGWAVGMALTLGLLLATARAPRLATMGLLVLLVVELFAASFTLPHSRATAPQAFTSLRPAIAHLLAAGAGGGDPPARFLSMSDITFDPGDLPEIHVIYGPQLSANALYDVVVAAKHKEVLSPNLPLAFGLPAVDGYDGGVLPLAHYVALQRTFLPQDEVSIDGRLRENLSAIPDGRWLSLLNVRHVITDKLHDAWLDDVFYDLQFGAQLARGETAAVAHVPHFAATALGIVSHLHGGAALPDGTSVGIVEVGLGTGLTRTFELRAGQHTAEGLYGPHVAHALAPVGGHFWPPALGQVQGGALEGNDYVTRLRWHEPTAPATVAVRATLPQGELVVRGMSLIDERTGGFQALVLSDQSRFRLAHSGDVKIYENLDVLPRAFLVHRGIVAADDAALALMRAAPFDPAAAVVLSQGEGTVLVSGASGDRPPQAGESVRMIDYTPQRVEIEVTAEGPGYLVLTDAWYPGWEATVDREPVPVYRADLLFRAVVVHPGNHRVVFAFQPVSVCVGAGISLAVLFGLVVVAALTLYKARRNAIMGATVVQNSQEGK